MNDSSKITKLIQKYFSLLHNTSLEAETTIQADLSSQGTLPKFIVVAQK